MDRDRHRLDKCALIRRKAGRQRNQAFSWDVVEFPPAAVGLESADLQVFANIETPLLAGVAVTADDLWQRGYLAPDGGHVFGTRADRLHDPRELVSLDHGVRRKGMRSVPHMNVGSANADLPNANPHLSLSWGRFGRVTEFDVAWPCHDRLFHNEYPLRVRSADVRRH